MIVNLYILLLTKDIKIETPSGKQFALASASLRNALTKSSGLECELIKLNRGTYDCMPISIMTTATLKKLQEFLGSLFDKQRFRYNILIESDASDETLLSKSLQLGNTACVYINYPTQRCQIVNLSPRTAESEPNILKQLSQNMNACAGVYASFKQPGSICTNDKVFLKE